MTKKDLAKIIKAYNPKKEISKLVKLSKIDLEDTVRRVCTVDNSDLEFRVICWRETTQHGRQSIFSTNCFDEHKMVDTTETYENRGCEVHNYKNDNGYWALIA